jgi:hypothetical protein
MAQVVIVAALRARLNGLTDPPRDRWHSPGRLLETDGSAVNDTEL